MKFASSPQLEKPLFLIPNFVAFDTTTPEFGFKVENSTEIFSAPMGTGGRD